MIFINPCTVIGSVRGGYLTNGTDGAPLALSARNFCNVVLGETDDEGNHYHIGREKMSRSDFGCVFRTLDAFDRFYMTDEEK